MFDTDHRDVGRVGAFLVDPTDQAITHLVVHQSHLFGSRSVTIPLTEIADVSERAEEGGGDGSVRLTSRLAEIRPREDVEVNSDSGAPHSVGSRAS